MVMAVTVMVMMAVVMAVTVMVMMFVVMAVTVMMFIVSMFVSILESV